MCGRSHAAIARHWFSPSAECNVPHSPSLRACSSFLSLSRKRPRKFAGSPACNTPAEGAARSDGQAQTPALNVLSTWAKAGMLDPYTGAKWWTIDVGGGSKTLESIGPAHATEHLRNQQLLAVGHRQRHPHSLVPGGHFAAKSPAVHYSHSTATSRQHPC